MTFKEIAPKDLARQHLQAALDTGVRGNLRAAIKAALAVADDVTPTDITELHYRNMKPGKLVDKARPGLLMRFGPRRGKVWVFRTADPDTGKQREIQFGTYPEVSVAEARERWVEMRSARQQDRLPTGMKERSDGLNMGALCDRYINEYAVKYKRSWSEDKRMLERHVVPHWKNRPVEAFDYDAISALLRNLHAQAPREAEKLRSCLSTMFNVAVGKTSKMMMAGATWLAPGFHNPVESVVLPKRKVVSYKPTEKELAGYLRGLSKLGDAGTALRVQIQTFARVAEVAGMEWRELDLDAGRWTLPEERTKNGHEHVVMLSDPTVAALKALPRAGKYVFPSPTNPYRAVNTANLQRAIANNRKILGITGGFTSHSIRHAGITWLAEKGCSREVRDRLTNHRSGGGVDAHYNAAQLNGPARDWTAQWCNYLAGLEAENVVSITGART